jgi:hypothetical protein
MSSSSFIENPSERNFLVTSVDQVINWARESSLWPRAPAGLILRGLEQKFFVLLPDNPI